MEPEAHKDYVINVLHIGEPCTVQDIRMRIYHTYKIKIPIPSIHRILSELQKIKVVKKIKQKKQSFVLWSLAKCTKR